MTPKRSNVPNLSTHIDADWRIRHELGIFNASCAYRYGLEGVCGGYDILSLGVRFLLLLFAFTLTTLILDVLVVYGHGLVNLGPKSAVIIDTKMLLAIVHTVNDVSSILTG